MQEYSFSNKEPLLEALSSPDFDNRKNFGLYQNELNGINSGENTPDFLEILPWNRIGKIAELLISLSSNDLIGDAEDNQSRVQTKYNQYCHETISNFESELQLLLNSVDTKSKTRSLLLTSRKV